MNISDDELMSYVHMSDKDFEANIIPQFAKVEGLSTIGDFLKQIELQWRDLLNSCEKKFNKKICIELKYCEISSDTDLQFIIAAICSFLVVDAGSFSLPIGIVAVCAIKYGWLDNFCDCPTGLRERFRAP